MARPSSTQRPYLVCRPDTKSYAYQREFDPDVAVLIVGEITRPWAKKPYQITGGSLMKVSLKTSDQAMAQDRWLEVHNQVETRVKRARELLNAARESEVSRCEPQMRVALAQEELSILAGQMRHDILADDDRAWQPGEHLRGPARAVRKIAGKLLNGEAARRIGHEAETRVLREALARRSTAPVETTTHLLLDPATASEILDRVAGSRGLLDHLVGLDGDRPEVDPSDLAALSALASRPKQASEVDERLSENGIALPPGSPARAAAARELMRAAVAAHQDVDVRTTGTHIETPARPAPIVNASEPIESIKPKSTKPMLSVMFKKWAEKKGLDEKTIEHNKLYIDRFIAMFGDLPVDQIEPEHVAEFRDTIALFPRDVPPAMRDWSPRDIVAWADSQGESLRRIKPQTVNTRALGALSTVLRRARKAGAIQGNPCAGMNLDVDEQDVKDVDPFTIDELNRFFAAPELTNIWPDYAPSGGVAAYWMPRIALFSGCRIEEIAQLELADIVRLDGIDALHITTFQQEKGKDVKPKTVKTRAARRLVPIHRILIDQGFLTYVEERRKAGDLRLFPLIDSKGKRRAKNISRWFGRIIDKYLTKDERLNFHSFRHTFADALINCRQGRDMRKSLFGHAPSDVLDTYGDGHSTSELNYAIQLIRYSGLVLPPMTIRVSPPRRPSTRRKPAPRRTAA